MRTLFRKQNGAIQHHVHEVVYGLNFPNDLSFVLQVQVHFLVDKIRKVWVVALFASHFFQLQYKKSGP